MALIEYHPPLEPYLDIIYQDNHICVVNKPSGLLSVPGNQPEYYDSAMSRVKEKFGFCESCTPFRYGHKWDYSICIK